MKYTVQIIEIHLLKHLIVICVFISCVLTLTTVKYNSNLFTFINDIDNQTTVQTSSKPTLRQQNTDYSTLSNSNSHSPTTGIATRTSLIYSSLLTTELSASSRKTRNTSTRQPILTTDDRETGRNRTSKYTSQPPNTQSTTMSTKNTISASTSGQTPSGKSNIRTNVNVY